MKYRFEKFSRNNMLLSVVMAVLGLALILWPGKTLELTAKIVGIALLVGAAITGFSWFKDRKKPGADYTSLAIAILCLILGLIVLIAPKGVISLMPKLIGAVVALNGILNLAQALEMRQQSGGNWVSSVVMAVLTIVAGLFLIFFAFSAMKAAVMVIGGVLLYNGVSNLLIESKYRKAGK